MSSRQAFRFRAFWTMIAVMFLVSTIVDGMLVHMVALLRDRGLDAKSRPSPGLWRSPRGPRIVRRHPQLSDVLLLAESVMMLGSAQPICRTLLITGAATAHELPARRRGDRSMNSDSNSQIANQRRSIRFGAPSVQRLRTPRSVR